MFIPFIVGTILFLSAGSITVEVGKKMGINLSLKSSAAVSKKSNGISSTSSKLTPLPESSVSSENTGDTGTSSATSEDSSQNSSGADSASSGKTTGDSYDTNSSNTGSSSATSEDSSQNSSDTTTVSSSDRETQDTMLYQMKYISNNDLANVFASNSESVSTVSIRSTTVGNVTGTLYSNCGYYDYLIGNDGHVYYKMNEKYMYDSDGNTVSTTQLSDWMFDDEHYWQMVK